MHRNVAAGTAAKLKPVMAESKQYLAEAECASVNLKLVVAEPE
jgi:hypothetical protein